MEQFKEFFKADRFAANAGVELLEVNPGAARARMLVTPYAKVEPCLHWPTWPLRPWRIAITS